MVSKLLKLFNRDIVSMNQAALVLAVFSVLSQVFGLIRDRLLASLVGPSSALDVYYASFRIPDFIYNSFGILFSVTVLIPFITEYLREEEKGNASKFTSFLNSVFTVYMYGMTAVCLVLIVLMPWLTKLAAPGFTALQHIDLTLFSRIMLLSPFLFGLSSLLSSFAQVQKKFLAFAIAPVFYNMGILAGVLFLRPHFGMLGVVIGVVIGATMHFLIQIPPLANLRKLPVLTKKVDWVVIKRVMILSLPRTIGSSLSNITFIIMAAIASLLTAGSISVFQLSYNIENSPLLIFGVSYAIAAFPTMARFFADGYKKEMMDVLYRTTRNLFFFTIPIALLMIVLRAHIVRLLLGAGEFSWNDTRLVAASVALFCISITAQSMVLLLVRAFFAVGDTWNPLKVNLWAVFGTGLIALGLVYCYQQILMFQYFIDSLLRIDGVVGGSVVLLALAFSVGQTWNAIALWRRFHKKMKVAQSETKLLRRTLSHMISAGIIAAATAYGTLLVIGASVDQSHFWGILVQTIIAGGVGLVAYSIVLIALGNEDITLFIHTLKSKFWKQKPEIVHHHQEL